MGLCITGLLNITWIAKKASYVQRNTALSSLHHAFLHITPMIIRFKLKKKHTLFLAEYTTRIGILSLKISKMVSRDSQFQKEIAQNAVLYACYQSYYHLNPEETPLVHLYRESHHPANEDLL